MVEVEDLYKKYGVPDSTELIIVPDGTAVVEDDLELTASSLRRYGTMIS